MIFRSCPCPHLSQKPRAPLQISTFCLCPNSGPESAGNLNDGGMTAENNLRDKLTDVRTHMDTCWAGLQSKATNIGLKMDQLFEVIH